jgi:uroporphyrinogen-III synthase
MTAFISRALVESPVFAARLQSEGWTVYGQSLLQLSPLPFTLPFDNNPGQRHWYFFSSKNAVQFFFEYLPAPLPAAHFAAIGPGTANALRSFISKIDFTGNGDPIAAAAAFLPLAQAQTVVFPCALHSRHSVLTALSAHIRGIPLAVYTNTTLPDPPLQAADVLVFTSPLNAAAYFSKHSLQPYQRVVAIGTPTAATLQSYHVPALIAHTASEAGLVEAVLKTVA